MYYRRTCVSRIVRIRNIKIALLVQSVVTTTAVVYLMLQTATLDQASRWELELTDSRCRGCCTMQNESVLAIASETRLSEKLHKFSRAIRMYEIPEDVMKILHDAEHKIEEFENELKQFKQVKQNRLNELQGIFIEEDIDAQQELVPKAKPKLKPIPKQNEKPVLKPASKPVSKAESTAEKVAAATKIPNDVHNEIIVKLPV